LGFVRKTKRKKKSNDDLINQLKSIMGFPVSDNKKIELGHEFSSNGLTVHVWTSYIEEDGEYREHDFGWIPVTSTMTGEAVYFAKPFMRTENFVPRLLRYAEIIQKKIVNRPQCPTCGTFMDIHSGIGKSTYWFCKLHDKWETMSWDFCLTPEEKKFLKIRRKQTKKYNEKRVSEGKPKRGTALRRRSKNKNV
jgi:ribosomal protein S27AE